MTPLDKPLRRQVEIDGKPYTVTLDALGLKLTKRAHRNGVEFRWQDLVNGDAAVAAALNAGQPPGGSPG
jgi:hypothetical protein